jgi:hypothetical protein
MGLALGLVFAKLLTKFKKSFVGQGYPDKRGALASKLGFYT